MELYSYPSRVSQVIENDSPKQFHLPEPHWKLTEGNNMSKRFPHLTDLEVWLYLISERYILSWNSPIPYVLDRILG
jgi:hypothetical protein